MAYATTALHLSWQKEGDPEHWSLEFNLYPEPDVILSGVGVPSLDQIIVLLAHESAVLAGVVYAAAMSAYNGR